MNTTPTFTFVICSLLYPLQADAGQQSEPPLMLASDYQELLPLGDYLISEKLDGIRAYWDGQLLWTRSGNQLMAPSWFTQHFPATPLDGELWLGRNQFEQAASLALSGTTKNPLWRKASFMVFDLPASPAPFGQRDLQLRLLIERLDIPHLKRVGQFSVQDQDELESKLEQLTQAGAEGLILRLRRALYEPGRSQNLIKLKQWQDAEAIVTGYQDGQGKYRGLMGALWVTTEAGKRFKIGTGFTLNQRQNPPALGRRITYKYQGHTRTGLPRFASFLRERPEE